MSIALKIESKYRTYQPKVEAVVEKRRLPCAMGGKAAEKDKGGIRKRAKSTEYQREFMTDLVEPQTTLSFISSSFSHSISLC